MLIAALHIEIPECLSGHDFVIQLVLGLFGAEGDGGLHCVPNNNDTNDDAINMNGSKYIS